MNENILSKTLLLKSEIEKSPEVIELERLNALLNKDEEVMKLCYKKDMCILNYEDALKFFGENSENAKKAQQELHKIKLALDENKLVKQYNSQFKIVRNLYNKINEELFNPFK